MNYAEKYKNYLLALAYVLLGLSLLGQWQAVIFIFIALYYIQKEKDKILSGAYKKKP